MATCEEAAKNATQGIKLRLTLISVGKVPELFAKEACAVYAERIRRYAKLNLVVVPEERISSRGNRKFIIHREGGRIREKIPPAVFTVAVDEKGKSLSSEAFARCLEKWSNSGLKEVAFILGGPYGLDEALREEADFCLCLSPMTLTHSLARVLLLEQIYRAFTILRGEPYHK
ncbi:MAG: 23S rRNA (pseudouridine(1915)-N(3))-methyltransferase RlmH [Deltaproteobacteria bacterium]|nr:23S rRNA (pseudouridine(1915)-N(3))-methyltransferase RlmH [Deltaproteobacteria bacterium]